MRYLNQPPHAGMAKLADAADLKSAGPKGLWGFKSPSRHQNPLVRSIFISRGHNAVMYVLVLVGAHRIQLLRKLG
jgi:hypothetical protein